MHHYIQVGCGRTPVKGWLNFDNSLAVRLARLPLPVGRLLPANSRDFMAVAKAESIQWCDATRRIPVPDSSAEVVYSSHMIEHLDRGDALAFLREAFRVLRPGGIVRVCAPDMRILADEYGRTGDADYLMERMLMAYSELRGLVGRLKSLAVGFREHRWMYDPASMCRTVESVGFSPVRSLPAGETMIADPKGLDLRERAEDSLYVEGVKPAR